MEVNNNIGMNNIQNETTQTSANTLKKQGEEVSKANSGINIGKNEQQTNNNEASSLVEAQKSYPSSEKIAEEKLKKAIQEANKKIAPTQSYLSYSIHKVTKDVMIKIINSDTNEIIKEFPPEKKLDAVAKMWELAGILVDEKR